MGASQGWVNDVLTPRTLKAYIDDELHHLKLVMLTVFRVVNDSLKIKSKDMDFRAPIFLVMTKESISRQWCKI